MLLGRRIDELKGWHALGVEQKLDEASDKLEDRLAIEIGLLDGVEPRLEEKDISLRSVSDVFWFDRSVD